MKIENGSLLEQAIQPDSPFEKAKAVTSFSEVAKAKADALDKSIRMTQTGYDKEDLTGKSAMEEFQEKMSGQMDAAERKKQMAVMSNTMTPEDYQKAKEAGFPVNDMDSDTMVTVIDKIKVQLAKAGVDISGLGDSLTKEQLEAIGGSTMAATQLQQCFDAADVPMTEENLVEGVEAYQQATELQPLSEGAIKYMLDNHLSPSIENLYLAEFSGSETYVAPQENEIDFEALRPQLEQVITAAGAEISEQTIADSQWMIQSEIAFTVDNFSYMQKLCGLQFPIEGKEIAKAIATAISEGERPKDAMLLPEYSATAQAEHAVEVVMEATDEDLAYLVANHMEITVESLEQTMVQREKGTLDMTGVKAVIEAGNVAETALAAGSDVGRSVSAKGRNMQSVSRVGSEILGEGTIDEILEGAEVDTAGRVTAAASNQRQGSTAEQDADTGFEFIRARRILEETRLAMTTEANRALMKQGISIDTKPLEELVEQLKEQENNYYATLLGESGEVADGTMTALFEETTRKVSDLKEMPAYVLGMRSYNLNTVNELHEAGTVLKDTFEKAGESYEALMTAPRKDLGDSIQKAFANVDDILTDLGMETSEANRRSVRILAYNNLDINEESILNMKAADERVQRTFSNLTPQTVRELIRQGCNPLDMSLEELNATAEAIRTQSSDADTEKFSEYLWKLEQNHEISPKERESYIGIYRLIHQIEKGDGAAIGALVSQGAEITMRNLLTAARSTKKSGMDYKVDDAFTGVDQAEGSAKSITEQIDTAYQTACIKDVMETMTPVTMKKLLESPEWENYTPEQLKEVLMQYARETAEEDTRLEYEYARTQLAEVEQAAASDEEVYRLLERFELPSTVNNILAANRLLHKRNQVFSQLFNSEEVFSGEPVDFAAIQEEILERFSNALKTPKEMAAAQEVLAETAENVMKTMIADDEHITSMDIRELKLMNTQLSIAGKMAEEEQYTIPVLVGDQVTNLSLKIVRGTKKRGMVEIMFEMSKAGRVAASIAAKEDGISGLVAADSKELQELLAGKADSIVEAIGEGGSLQCTYAKDLDFAQFSGNTVNEEADGTNPEYEVQTARLYKIAKSFIEAVKELEV